MVEGWRGGGVEEWSSGMTVMVEGWDDSAREGRKWMSTWETAGDRETVLVT